MHSQHEYRYCPVCGGNIRALKIREHEPERLRCDDCSFVFYLDPKVVACTIIEKESGIILLKRNIDPEKGKWVVPGGYVDRGEKVENAAIREAREECGLDIHIKELSGVYSYPGVLEVMVFYIGESVSGTLIAGDETQEAKLCRPEAIPWQDLAFQSTVDALKDYCALRKK